MTNNHLPFYSAILVDFLDKAQYQQYVSTYLMFKIRQQETVSIEVRMRLWGEALIGGGMNGAFRDDSHVLFKDPSDDYKRIYIRKN